MIKTLRAPLAFLAIAILVIAAAAALMLRNREPSYTPPAIRNDIPLPFSMQGGSDLAGALTPLDYGENFDVYQVDFPPGVTSETLSIDSLYLVYVPDDSSIIGVPMDIALVKGQSRRVNYFGYKYTSATAEVEKLKQGDPVFKNRFPGQFFVSATAKAQDAQGNFASFEQANGVTFAKTDATPGAARLEKGSLYLIVVNDDPTAFNIKNHPVLCADGYVMGEEPCDDGNTTAGDGCSAVCAVEQGWSCTGSPSACVQTNTCGDGKRMGEETCDDGNKTAGDGCSATCAVEAGYTCTIGTPDVCTKPLNCGNNVLDDGEECDDGNTMNGDFCTSTCTYPIPIPF